MRKVAAITSRSLAQRPRQTSAPAVEQAEVGQLVRDVQATAKLAHRPTFALRPALCRPPNVRRAYSDYAMSLKFTDGYGLFLVPCLRLGVRSS